MDLVCRIATVGNTPVLHVAGDVDLSTLPMFRDHLMRLVHDHRGAQVLVDLDGVLALDDTGLGLLLGAAARARDLGGDLELQSSAGRVRDRLVATRLHEVVALRP